MIEIIGNERATKIINAETKIQKIEGLVRAWAKIDNDDCFTKEQKNFVTRSVMSEVWRIVEEEK